MWHFYFMMYLFISLSLFLWFVLKFFFFGLKNSINSILIIQLIHIVYSQKKKKKKTYTHCCPTNTTSNLLSSASSVNLMPPLFFLESTWWIWAKIVVCQLWVVISKNGWRLLFGLGFFFLGTENYCCSDWIMTLFEFNVVIWARLKILVLKGGGGGGSFLKQGGPTLIFLGSKLN